MWCSKLVNFSFLSFCAASRTPSNPRDLGTNGVPSELRLCIRSSSDCSMFSLVSPLPSIDSAGSGTPPLLAGFFGTMERSDPRRRAGRTCGLAPSPTDPLPWKKRMSPGSLGFREKSVQPCLWSQTPWGSHRTCRCCST